MKIITCENKRIDKKGRLVKCNQWLGMLTDLQLDVLKIDDEKKATFRCRLCPSGQRWIDVGYENDKLIFRASGNKPGYKNEPIKYDIIDNFQEVI